MIIKNQFIISRLQGLLQCFPRLTMFRLSALVFLFFLTGLVGHYRTKAEHKGSGLDWTGRLENTFLDMRFHIRGELKPSGHVGVLAIDEASLQRFGRWPFSRKHYLPAFENLQRRGVQWIGLDVQFSEPEPALFEDAVPSLRASFERTLKLGWEKFQESALASGKESLGDRELEHAIRTFKNVVQGFFYYNTMSDQNTSNTWSDAYERITESELMNVAMVDGSKGKLSDFNSSAAPQLVTNVAGVTSASPYAGFLNNDAHGGDGIVRSVNLIRATQNPDAQNGGDPHFFASVSLKLASLFLKRDLKVLLDDFGIRQLSLFDPEERLRDLKIPQRENGRGWMLVNYYGPSKTIPHISLADADLNQLPPNLPEVLILGAVANGIGDVKATPYSPATAGVEIHATVVDNIVSGRFLRRSDSFIAVELAILVASWLLLTLLLSRTNALTSLGAMIGLAASVFLLDHFWLFGRGYWFYLGTFYLQTFSVFVALLVFKYFKEESKRKQVRAAFSHYLHPSIIDQIIQDPSALKLGGEKRDLTIFFSDIRNFTSISEAMEPEALTTLLNDYFHPMSHIILETEGLLDKYIGDAIMAVWGAPHELEDHADRAVRASLMMLQKLEELQPVWNDLGRPAIEIGIGLNTGSVAVGNMGGHRRFNYTVLGDAVNLAARLEGITKTYGVKIVISEYTYRALVHPEEFLLREVDTVVVKGKADRVRIFEVVAFASNATEEMRRNVALFADALNAYRNRDWDTSKKEFEKLVNLAPADKTAKIFLERANVLSSNPPGADWNGAWVMTEK
jgi:adenylate cyclase